MRPSNAQPDTRYFCVKCGDSNAECSCSPSYAWRWDSNLQPVTEDGRVFRDVLASSTESRPE